MAEPKSDYPTSVRLTRELKAALLRYAKAQGTSVNWLISYICRQWVEIKDAEERNK